MFVGYGQICRPGNSLTTIIIGQAYVIYIWQHFACVWARIMWIRAIFLTHLGKIFADLGKVWQVF